LADAQWITNIQEGCKSVRAGSCCSGTQADLTTVAADEMSQHKVMNTCIICRTMAALCSAAAAAAAAAAAGDCFGGTITGS
jgi:hypothetical protein